MFTIRTPENWLFFGAITTLGSLAGCYALYSVGRKGGEALVRRGFHERHVDRVLGWYQRYGAAVLIVPALMPPPMPFKIFVLMAGLAGIRPSRFLLAIAAGRGLRYCGEAWLARQYGTQTLAFLEQHALSLVWPTVALAAVAGLGWWVWSAQRRKADVE